MDSFAKLLVGLQTHGVEFIVVGGLAVAFNGFNRYTEDVDLLVQTSPDNLRRMLDVLAGFGEGTARSTSKIFPSKKAASASSRTSGSTSSP